jgi:nucleotide-binding universal stress UspA family protein
VVASDTADTPAAFRDVLVAVDLSPASTDVLSAAIALTKDHAVRMTVMHTVTGVEGLDAARTPARWTVPEYRTHVLEDARRALEAVMSTVPASVDARVKLSTGSPARAILDDAADVDADLVVVGRSRGFTLLGSTALRVLRKNERALLVVPGPARVERQLAA